ncbi:porin [Methyloligella sp. 2.7D]|uniref:OprO/OprP family phosphate-selective porin n=1 Tax=unclassified Methyloligella TaxID=2625955 RepID=UPI00157CF39C|nr:porin [Methyloligella sp. GL2]QKP77656.1 hypothetical protein HT051_09490 [Methyloligella sp. GL2]
MNRFLIAGVSALAILATSATMAHAEDDDLDLKVKWKGAPEFSSKDGSFKFKVRGRVMTDYVSADQDQPITGEPDVNATECRRCRLGVEGVVYTNIKYKFEVDFADGETDVTDAYLQYKSLPVGITIGQFKTYNSLEEQTSSRYITFMERAAITDAFDLQRQIGIGLSKKEEQWTASAGLYSGNINDDAHDEGSTFAARVTVAPILTDRKVVHLGAHVRQRDDGNPNEVGLYRYRQRAADFHLTDRFVDTGEIADADNLWGLEFAAVLGSFSVQSEYMQLNADTPTSVGLGSPTYDGWYVDASWFITGEMRNYDEGEFGRTKVLRPVNEGGPGAWQIAARYDVIDLSDGGCADCGEQNTWLIGLNWHLNNYTRLMLNVNQSEIDGGANDGAQITGVGMRAQVDW